MAPWARGVLCSGRRPAVRSWMRLHVPVRCEIAPPTAEPGPPIAWTLTARGVLGVLGPSCRARAAKPCADKAEPLSW
eukprot:9133986-Alexandrium_andersonii.AAC.1